MYQRKTHPRSIASALHRRSRIYKIQKGLCDVCKDPIEILYCFEVREKPSKHMNLLCYPCKKGIDIVYGRIRRLEVKYAKVLLYLKRKKMYHKALLKLNNIRSKIELVKNFPPKAP